MAPQDSITKELLESALKDYFANEKINILNYTSSFAVPKGDNYTSDLFRTSVTYETDKDENKRTISLIVKCAPEKSSNIYQLVQDLKLFENEGKMYTKTLPAMDDLLGKRCNLSANIIYYTNIPHTILVFEDLAPLGFKMHNRHSGLDLEHCCLVVERIAYQHAASAILYEKDPSLVANYGSGLFNQNETIVEWILKAYESLIKSCVNWPGFEKYSRKLELLRNNIMKRTTLTTKRQFGGFNVLNHGDAWTNNIMFSYDSNDKLKECRFVDYQLILFTSPAIDLHYFWTTSPRLEVRKVHLGTILDHYYSELLRNLSNFKYPIERIPTKKQFLDDWKSKAFYGLTTAAVVLPIIKATSRTDASFEALMASEDEGSFRHHAYNTERYRKHMEHLLPFFDELGVFDSD